MQISGSAAMRTASLTAAAMLAFAANSLLCRLALGAALVDPASFTAVRVVSGAASLSLIAALRRSNPLPAAADWKSAAMLFLYMAMFSFAYRYLSAGTGALILFGAVQLTMFAAALRNREPFSPLSWAGLAMAVFGLVYLVSPGLSAPDPLGAALMTLAGMAWGFYSLRGRNAANPLVATTRNFVFSVPAAVVLSLLFIHQFSITAPGLALAMASGALTSGIGYVIWYAALPSMAATRAATVQLSVPVIAAIGGALILFEPLTWRLILASAAVLGGVALVLGQRRAEAPK